MDPLTLVTTIVTVLTILNNALSFLPEGYPHSIAQVFIYCGYHIYHYIRPSNNDIKQIVDEGLKEVVI